MKRIQIKIDREARTAAIYMSGKLINLSIPSGWMYFYIYQHRIDSDISFIAFLNAVACETEKELEHFKPLLSHYVSLGSNHDNWREVLDTLTKKIEEADYSKIRPSYRAIAVVHKQKLVMFLKDKEGDYCADGVKISNSMDIFQTILKAIYCETEQELDLFMPMLDTFDPDWRDKAKIIKNCLVDNQFE